MQTQANKNELILSGNKVGHSLHLLFEDYQKDLNGINQISNFVCGKDTLINYFLSGNETKSFMAKEIFGFDGAKRALDAHYWQRAIDMTDVLDAMPAKKRNEWSEMIHEMKTPDFNEESVITTIQSLLSQRTSFFADKVDGLFQKLSGKHVTNAPMAFGERMILDYVFDKFGYVNYNTAEYIDDLRDVVARIQNRNETQAKHRTTKQILKDLYDNHNGQWMSLDGGSLRVKVFKKGTAHLEVEESTALKLNDILASKYPKIIGTAHNRKTSVRKASSDKSPLRVVCVSMEARDFLSSAIDDISRKGSCYFTYSELSKNIEEELKLIFKTIGGEEVSDGHWIFSADVTPAISLIVRSGELPEQKSHQFYPTPTKLAKRLVDMADIKSSDLILEPSAGNGGIAELLPKEKLTCIEISPLHCKVLESKGFKTICDDFMLTEFDSKFDKIFMNPPFNHSQAFDHFLKAVEYLNHNGEIYAILPPTAANKVQSYVNNRMRGCAIEISEPVTGAFEDTLVTVVLVSFKK